MQLQQQPTLTYEQLSEQNRLLQQEHEALKANYALLKEQMAQLQRMIFGTKSERFVPSLSDAQGKLDLNAEVIREMEIKKAQISYERTKVQVKTKHKGRNPLPAHLPRVIIELAPEENTEGLVSIGEEVTEELDFTPGKFFVNQYRRKKYITSDKRLITASLPPRPVEKGIPGPGLLAQIIIDKYVDHLPLNRQLQRFKREGMEIAPATISDWTKAGIELLAYLYVALKQKAVSASYLMADETPMQVLDKEKGVHQGYYWVYRSPLDGLVLFDYQKGRGREGPSALLKDFKGFLQTDGYVVYEEFDSKEGITLMHCMAHARRYFEQALDNDRVRAEFALQKIQLLYAIERKAREEKLSHPQRLELRQKESLPVLEEMKGWLKENLVQVLPKSTIGKAIAYAYPRWDKLSIYATHGQLEIDNNPVENSIRPVAIGRKNYLFAGSHEAAERAAMIYSLLGTCKINGINPYQWLKDAITKIPAIRREQMIELLPVKHS